MVISHPLMKVLGMVSSNDPIVTKEDRYKIALRKLEAMLLSRSGLPANCVTAVSLQTGVSEMDIRRHWVLAYDMTVEAFSESMFGASDTVVQNWGSSGAGNALEQIKLELDQELEERNPDIGDFSALDSIDSIFDIPNYKEVPINPPATEDPKIYEAEKLKIAAGWLENLVLHFSEDPNILVKRVAAVYALDEWDLKIEFDIRTNCDVYAYHNLFHQKEGTKTPVRNSGGPIEVIDKGDGRTVYKYGRNSSTSSTTYYHSAYEAQHKAWQKLEEMAKRAKEGLSIGISDVQT
jgi:hypothetical protein